MFSVIHTLAPLEGYYSTDFPDGDESIPEPATLSLLGLKQANFEGPNSGIGDDFLGAKNVS